jgi:hypothetical protein
MGQTETQGLEKAMAGKRHQRSKHQIIRPWPTASRRPQLWPKARYVGSSEHKDYESAAGPPALRSDAARCDPQYTDFEVITNALQEAIRHCCCSAHFEGKFPRHVWGWLDGRLYEARLVNRVQGWYKAWPIEESERPRDNDGRLNW